MSGGATLTPALSQRERESNLRAAAGAGATLTPALSQRERESGLRALAGAGPTLTPALSQRERESDILPSFPRRRESIAALSAAPLSRMRHVIPAKAGTYCGPLSASRAPLNSLSLWERAGVRVAGRRAAPLLSHVGASSFPRKREPTANRSNASRAPLNSLSLWERAGVRAAAPHAEAP